MSPANGPHSGRPPRWLVYAVLLGLYLTFRGYHSLDGDQAFRLPLLLHHQDPKLYAGDPFVRSFDAFNPHSGSILVLDLVTRPLGLSCGLFLVFALTFAATSSGVDRLARGVWPSLGPGAGLVAVSLVLAAKAGNIGTNHIFEAMVLDRQIAFALGWLALAQLIVQPDRGRPLVMAAIAAAALVHPTAGLQLALTLSASVAAWSLLGQWTEVTWRDAILWILSLAAAVIPGLASNVHAGSQLLGEMPTSDFWLLSVELQSPQHMLPHLWRMPQWLACLSYFALAALAVGARRSGCVARPNHTDRQPSPTSGAPAALVRLVTAMVVVLSGLTVAWCLIEKRHALQVTVFQPFRMATVARGIALALIAGRITALWKTGDWLPRMRAILLAVSVTGDWLMVVITLAELVVSSVEAVRIRLTKMEDSRRRRLPGHAVPGTQLSGPPRHGIWALAAACSHRRRCGRCIAEEAAETAAPGRCEVDVDMDTPSRSGNARAGLGCAGRGPIRGGDSARSPARSLRPGARPDQPVPLRGHTDG
jgi:hypothetical protein